MTKKGPDSCVKDSGFSINPLASAACERVGEQQAMGPSLGSSCADMHAVHTPGHAIDAPDGRAPSICWTEIE